MKLCAWKQREADDRSIWFYNAVIYLNDANDKCNKVMNEVDNCTKRKIDGSINEHTCKFYHSIMNDERLKTNN